jgi:hypothetical protein
VKSLSLLKKALKDPGKIPQALRIESVSLGVILRYGLPDVMLQFLGGIGDELLLTAVAHELKKRSLDQRIWQVSHSPDLFRYNPDYARVFDWRLIHLRYSNLLNSRRVHLSYTEEIIPGELDVPPAHHIIAQLCRKAGVSGEIAIRPYLYLDENEKKKGRLFPLQIVLHCVGDSSYENVMRNKRWPPNRFKSLVQTIKQRHIGGTNIEIIQVGISGDPYIDGCFDLRGKTSLRETAAIINQAEAFVGTSGLLSHMARAVDCRSVIIYGGREHSSQTGYICNENLDSFVPCAPCWQWERCDFNRKCMDMITVDDVAIALSRVIEKKDKLLEVARFVL